MAPLVEIRNLVGYFRTYEGKVHAINGVNLTVEEGKVLGLVGETGSGKSVTASVILRILPENFQLVSGEILFRGGNLLRLGEGEMRDIRGNRISMVFQDARAALNPVFTIGEQMARVARQHSGISAEEAHRRVIEMLGKVQMGEPERRARQYAHELSGGMCQRAMIGMALMHSPELLILDEPTTGLDVTVQAEILDLLRQLVRGSGVTALLITHDLGVVAEICDMVAVMYAGWVVEYGSAQEIFERPSHPYTRELRRASLSVEDERVAEPYSIPGTVPDLRELPGGCLFADRCPNREPQCDTEPPVVEVGRGHLSKCHFARRFHEEQSADRTVTAR